MCAESLGSNPVTKVFTKTPKGMMNCCIAIDLNHVGQIGAMHAFLRSDRWRLGTTAILCVCYTKSA
jgi:hypothetical protein